METIRCPQCRDTFSIFILDVVASRLDVNAAAARAAWGKDGCDAAGLLHAAPVQPGGRPPFAGTSRDVATIVAGVDTVAPLDAANAFGLFD